MSGSREFFTASVVVQVRGRLSRHLRRPEPHPPHGWSKVAADLAALVRDLRHLRLKAGLALRGYQFLDRNNGWGQNATYAMPDRAPFPEPDECPLPQDRINLWLDPPAPPGALDHFMEGFEGDGSPGSFLEASLLVRELADFTGYRFVMWPVETVLDSDPLSETRPEPAKWWQAPTRDRSRWTWQEPPPADWRPYAQVNDDGSAVVQFCSYHPAGVQSLHCHRDTYPPAGYRPDTSRRLLAKGPPSFHW